MKRKLFPAIILRHLVTASILALSLVTVISSPVAAIVISDYFTVSFSIEFNKTTILGSEVFYATVEGTATCYSTLPIALSEARITGRIIAEHQTSGATVILNSSYILQINPFPSAVGDVTNSRVVVPLAFPAGSAPGPCNVAGELLQV